MNFKNLLAKHKKWALTLRIIPIVLAILIVKYLLHDLGMEVLASNPFLPSLVAATVFLIGFLITGVLSDYKESEKLPAELAASLETIADETYIIYKNKKAPVAREFLSYLGDFSKDIEGWFYKKVRTRELLLKLRGFNNYFAEMEPLAQATFISRIKQEQQNLRKTITRIHTIKDTNFIGSGYAIAEGISALLIVAMLLTKMDPFMESMFFMIPIVYLFVYMIALIKDLDNPFEYDERGEAMDEVSIKEVRDEVARLGDRLAELDALGKKKN